MKDNGNKIRKEIKARIKELIDGGEEKCHVAQEIARREANAKYGYGWRLDPQQDNKVPSHEDGVRVDKSDLETLLSDIWTDARLALDDAWDRSDAGFVAQQNNIEKFASKYELTIRDTIKERD